MTRRYERDGTWYVQFDTLGSTRQDRKRIRKFGFKTKRDAELWEAAERSKLAGKSPALTTKNLTLSAMIEKYFRLHCEISECSPKTLSNYRQHRDYLSPELLSKPPAEISTLDWTGEWARLRASGGHDRRNKEPRPLSARSVSNVSVMISSIYKWAAKNGLVPHNPVADSTRPKITKHPAVILGPDDLQKLLNQRSGFWCLPNYLKAAAALGERRGELCALRWSDWKGREITVSRSLLQYTDSEGRKCLLFKHTKGSETHTVQVPESLVPVLEDQRRQVLAFKRQFGADYVDHDLIFSQENGAPLWPNSVTSAVSHLCRRLGLPKGASLHKLRHTHASILLKKGVPLTEVSHRLGHANVRITSEIYAHHIPHNSDRSAGAYDEFLAETKEEGGTIQ